MKAKQRYVIKSMKVPGRGGGPKITEYYVFDNEGKRFASASSMFKSDIEKMCKMLNEYDAAQKFEQIVLDKDVNEK